MDQMVQQKNNIVTLLLGYQSQIKALGVRRLGLFGSFVRGEQYS